MLSLTFHRHLRRQMTTMNNPAYKMFAQSLIPEFTQYYFQLINIDINFKI